ncbi:hypothetical protein P154DRAFT_518487 [Amniculicola lignicola CBS 123094]|uniref:Large ribosomal subunit protein mL67 n=1 Tax=Amniculicola lignicola CBS 123094 TaxID=1392246 RepID=A0A6A5WVM5_9PLEO|nr:hypothetical protein P154DRAFT_518487 [Amniculicola lignicola CBS 123094]
MPRAPPTAQRFLFPELPATDQHGKRIYVFRHLQTQQIIYSFYNGIQMQHIRTQLPFIGKHSVPSSVRRDLWTPHCVVTFPTARQGEHAFKLLREFRRLHELRWKEQNPEWSIELTKKQLIKKIMNQRANMTADLQKVLQIQAKIGKREEWEAGVHSELVQSIEKKRWAEIEELAALVDKGEVDRLEAKIQALQRKHERAESKTEEAESETNKESISLAMTRQRRRIKKLLWAKSEIETRDAELQRHLAIEQQKIDAEHAQLVSERNLQINNVREWNAFRRRVGEEKWVEIGTPKPPYPARIPPRKLLGTVPASENPYIKTVIPKKFATPPPEPFAVEGAVEVEWADIYDAEYAGPWNRDDQDERSAWPGIQIGTLDTVTKAHSFITEAEFEQQVNDEWQKMRKGAQEEAQAAWDAEERRLRESGEEEKKRSSKLWSALEAVRWRIGMSPKKLTA